MTLPPQEQVKWKDVLSNKWKGPDPILIRSRGAVCVFPQDGENPIWVPERLTRRVAPAPLQDVAMDADDSHESPADTGKTTMGDPV